MWIKLPKLEQKPKFYIGDYVRISKIYLPYRKCYKVIFTDKNFKIVTILNVIPPKYSLIDMENEEINVKFYEKNLIWLETKLITTKKCNEYTVHLVSTALMDYFQETLWPVLENFVNTK